MVMGTKTGQTHVRKQIDAFGEFGHHPEGMEIDPIERIYYKQFDLEYQIEGKRDNVKQADKLKLNLYFDPVRRGHELIDLNIAVKAQAEALEDIKMRQLPLDDDATIGRVYRFYTLEYDTDTRILKSYALDTKKVSKAKLSADRQRNSSVLVKEGRLFILFVAQIIGSYLAYIRRSKLSDQFHSIQDILNEMRPIRYIEHPGTRPFITPFIGKQIDICEAFGFEIPEGCSPEYAVCKTNKGKPGHPRKNKLVVKDS